MELHAWINPYRARMKSRIEPAPNHIVRTHPERVFEYDGLYVLNPGIPSNRDYICTIVKDIVKRYDIDGLHMDDYFYPYPVAGLSIPDSREFAAYNNGFKNIEDWRRDNVNLFIKQVNEAIKSVKPWVKFGVSPFGIYRNKKSDPLNGSDTNGTQNYDQLYADVLLWVNNGWIDYCVPQLYWEIGHKAADYKTLITWWNKYTANRHLYIGEDVERTVKYSDVDNAQSNQMPAKFKLHKQMKNVKGTVLWYSRLVVDDLGQYGSMLKNYYWKNPALPPLMPFIDKKAPKSPRHLEVVRMSDGNTVLCWDAPKGKKWGDVAEKFVVYKFGAGEKVNLSDPSKIVAITSNKMLKLPYVNGKNKYTYVVTALDRMSNESKGEKINVRL